MLIKRNLRWRRQILPNSIQSVEIWISLSFSTRGEMYTRLCDYISTLKLAYDYKQNR